VSVGASRDVECPCVIGYARPVIALPASLLAELDRSDLRRVLCHEIAHVRRYDDWANVIQQVIRAVWFFNPVVHFASRALDVDREIACDDLVAAGPLDRLEYAKCLTEIARRTTFAEHLVPAAGFFPDRRQIVVRIEKLLDRNHDGSPRVGAVPAAVAAIVLVFVFALAKHQVPAFAIDAPAASMAQPVPPAPAVQPVHQAPLVRPVAQLPKVKTVRPVRVRPATAARVVLTKVKVALRVPSPTRVIPVLARAIAPPAQTVRTFVDIVPRLAVAPVLAKSTAEDFLDALSAAGYSHLSVDELIAVRNAGVTSSYLRALKAYGITPMPVSKLMALANAGVSGEYIAAVRAAGYGDLSAENLISLANSGVTMQFIEEMARSGRARPTIKELVELSNAGVSASYVQNLTKYGYGSLSIDGLISLANAGVSSSYVGEMAKQGYKSMSVDTLTAFANAGVSPGYVRSLADVGYSKVSTDDLIRMANAGVTARLIKSLRSHGIGDKGNLSIDELIKLVNAGF
jgi:hypothetical protein